MTRAAGVVLDHAAGEITSGVRLPECPPEMEPAARHHTVRPPRCPPDHQANFVQVSPSEELRVRHHVEGRAKNASYWADRGARHDRWCWRRSSRPDGGSACADPKRWPGPQRHHEHAELGPKLSATRTAQDLGVAGHDTRDHVLCSEPEVGPERPRYGNGDDVGEAVRHSGYRVHHAKGDRRGGSERARDDAACGSWTYFRGLSVVAMRLVRLNAWRVGHARRLSNRDIHARGGEGWPRESFAPRSLAPAQNVSSSPTTTLPSFSASLHAVSVGSCSKKMVQSSSSPCARIMRFSSSVVSG